MAKHSERLREALDIRGMRPSTLSYKTGISEASISHYLKGHYEPKHDKMELLAKALRVSEAWLSGFDVPMVEQRENTDEIIPRDPELIEYLQMLKNRPEMKMLFSLAKDATVDDVKKAVAIIEALRKNSNE